MTDLRSKFFWGVRVGLGLVFAFAAYSKILDPQAFAETVVKYQILPGAAINAIALVLPWIEAFVAFCLISGIWVPGAVLLSGCMLLAFSGALIFNMARGLNVHCGCFSAAGDSADLWTVVRDTVLLCATFSLGIESRREKPQAA